MNEEEERETPFPQTGENKDQKYQSATYKKEGYQCNNPKLTRCSNIPVSCHIKEILFKIHPNPDIPCS
jgi:hypothetical protein